MNLQAQVEFWTKNYLLSWPLRREMAYLAQLPFDILDLIIIMLAISTNGAREIAHISATCKLFRNLAQRTHVLRKVNFSCLTYIGDFTKHHHRKDLLCLCTQLGHQAAKSLFAKALLYNDRWFRQMVAETNQEAFGSRVLYSGLLDYHSIVRSFIRHGSCTDILVMHGPLLNYVTSFVGFKVAHKFGMFDAFYNMHCEMAKRVREHRAWSHFLTGNPTIYPSLLDYQVRGERKKVLGGQAQDRYEFLRMNPLPPNRTIGYVLWCSNQQPESMAAGWCGAAHLQYAEYPHKVMDKGKI
ncbi:hypothetical protein L1987_50249 [Smallanthus sonchifolius]|uniref:Uncharacterized protein n=1 Tax=Smallanthus sonchifolius TaxID=185202 RepID=A0ACB9EMB4_9ASTR|nr:hypothetical protein L1987_50249 [Smallanthus sonchifolius]